jgi:CRISPR-associated protein Cas4
MKQQHSIPSGRIVYEDLFQPGKILYSKSYPLSGKPDYIIKQHHSFIPIEVKTGSHVQPRPHHIMQLASYCQLVSEEYQCSVPFGILVYYDSNTQFQIPFDKNIQKKLKTTIEEMNQCMQIEYNDFDQHVLVNVNKCTHCSMIKYCHIAQEYGISNQ